MSPLTTGSGRFGLIYNNLNSNGPINIPPTVANPSFSDVSLLLHMEGANNSTTFTDSSSFARTISVVNNAKISTTQFKYGSSSAYFDGDADRLQLTASALGSTFTIEYSFFYTSLLSAYTTLFDGRGGPYDNGSISLGIYSNNQIFLIINSPSAVLVGPTLTNNTWYHFAFSVNSGTGTAWLNGTQIGTSYTVPNQVRTVWYIGADFEGYGGLNGYIDEYRITKNDALYSTPFTPLPTAFPNS